MGSLLSGVVGWGGNGLEGEALALAASRQSHPFWASPSFLPLGPLL